MTISFECTECRKKVQVPDSAAGKRGKCPFCGNSVNIPAPVQQGGHAPDGDPKPGESHPPSGTLYIAIGVVAALAGLIFYFAVLEPKVGPMNQSLVAFASVLLPVFAVFLVYSSQAFQNDPEGGIDPLRKSAIRADLPAEEEILALTPTRKEVAGQTVWGVACLTNRRVLVFCFSQNGITPVLSGKRSMDVSQAVGLQYGEGGMVSISVSGAQQFDIFCPHISTRNVFIKKVESLLEQRSRANTSLGIADELGKLALLVQQGVLTEDEFARAKGMYLGKPKSKREEALDSLQKLYALFRSGVLTEWEFRTKKWDILSRQ